MKKTRFTLPLLLAALLCGCSSSPTGRNQMLLFSANEMKDMGEEAFIAIKQKEKPSRDQKMTAYVQCVARNVTAQVPRHYKMNQWEVVLFESKEVNAFALPGGKIGVYSGLLKVADNQDRLATVIGHEIAHVLSQHSNEQMSRQGIANVGLTAASAMGASRVSQAALGAGVQVGLLLPFSRAQENEADKLGLDLMARSGFNPSESVALWKKMAAQGGKTPPTILSTHPSNQQRIAFLQQELPQATPLYRNAQAKGLKPSCKL